jgi:hypothetical protein
MALPIGDCQSPISSFALKALCLRLRRGFEAKPQLAF